MEATHPVGAAFGCYLECGKIVGAIKEFTRAALADAGLTTVFPRAVAALSITFVWRYHTAMENNRLEHLFKVASTTAEETERARQAMLISARRRQEALLTLQAEGLSLRAIADHLGSGVAVIQAAVTKAKRHRPTPLHSGQRIGYEMHLAVGLKLSDDSENIRAIGRRNLEAMRRTQRSELAEKWLRRWEEILNLPDEELTEAILANDEFTADIRQVTPFAGVLDDNERLAAIRKARFLAAA